MTQLDNVSAKGDVQIDIVRHVPVSNPDRIWYGRDGVEFDSTSPRVLERFTQLANDLPSDPQKSEWYSSPFPRATATADGVGNALERPDKPRIILREEFVEQNYGVMTGRPHKEIIKDPDAILYLENIWSVPPRDGESQEMFQSRIVNAIHSCATNTSENIRNIVIFSHGGDAMAAFSHATHQRMSDVLKERKNPQANLPDFSFLSRLTLNWNNGTLKFQSYEAGIRKADYI